eukprot:SAG11_NODE_12023_length_725_cov_1.554313_1_plen_52_part_01
MDQKYRTILYARAYPILTVTDGSEQLEGPPARVYGYALCLIDHCIPNIPCVP